MKFSDLEIFIAIHKVREQIKADGENPGADHWTSSRALELTRRIVWELTTYPNESLMQMWLQYRKGPSSSCPDRKEKKLDIIVQLAMRDGARCFWEGRVDTQCSDELDLDRLLPESRGGEYLLKNCVLACSKHNRSRGDLSVEDFMAGKKTIPEE